MKFALLFGCMAGAALAACSSLPTAGPTASAVTDEQVKNAQRRYDVVDVSAPVVAALQAQPRPSFEAAFHRYGKPPPPKIGVGDTVSVTIWEAAAGGLFSSSPTDHLTTGSHSVVIPEQVVANDGAISVPYAGRVPVAGHTAEEVQNIIQQRLVGKALQPQVIVTVPKSVNYAVTVSGEVVSGARLPLSPNGDRLLDLIAAAGGAKAPVYETFVRLSRGGVTVTLPMERLVDVPAENIYGWPGDVLTLVVIPRHFSVLGATGQNAQLEFNAARMTLVQALARAGGLQDQRSDPEGVFLFRYEPPAVLHALHAPPLGTGPDGNSPVVYRLNMRDANSYFLAQRFPLENNDIIYVANARLDELQKFFTLLNTLTGPIVTGIVVNSAVH
ncbi:MAG TPA: polysaccharide biosynthesis/export family protein [Stellaceae bacterium]|nr:polysaccharide biosynthesis/export family protein [Stellaceae bacterium]